MASNRIHFLVTPLVLVVAVIVAYFVVELRTWRFAVIGGLLGVYAMAFGLGFYAVYQHQSRPTALRPGMRYRQASREFERELVPLIFPVGGFLGATAGLALLLYRGRGGDEPAA
jgi:hypothetical protein